MKGERYRLSPLSLLFKVLSILPFPITFRFIWPCGSREDFFKSANQKQELPMAAMFVNGSEQNEQSL
jgi:hypothetical protein